MAARVRVLLAALALAACSPRPAPSDPALWLVEGPNSQKAWLFGTIHAAPEPLAWRTRAVGDALDEADEVVVEVANLDDRHLGEVFATLSHGEGLPALPQRLPADLRPALAKLLKANSLDAADFADVETWAAALTLARLAAPDSEARNGVDRAVLAAARGKRIEQLEGASGQLRIFDTLPEREQRDLLAAVVTEAGQGETDISRAWRGGDMKAIAHETHSGLLADPELREALFSGRNRRWAEVLVIRMRAGRHPFVAVGAAHMASAEGLPAMLEAKGYTVTRLR